MHSGALLARLSQGHSAPGLTLHKQQPDVQQSQNAERLPSFRAAALGSGLGF